MAARKKEFFIVFDLTVPKNVGVVCPDLGVASAGDSEAHARLMISEAIDGYLEDYEEYGIEIPDEASTAKLIEWVEELQADGITKVKIDKIRVDIPQKPLKTRQIAVTISESDLAEIDAWRREHKIPRSRLLAKAALNFIHAG